MFGTMCMRFFYSVYFKAKARKHGKYVLHRKPTNLLSFHFHELAANLIGLCATCSQFSSIPFRYVVGFHLYPIMFRLYFEMKFR